MAAGAAGGPGPAGRGHRAAGVGGQPPHPQAPAASPPHCLRVGRPLRAGGGPAPRPGAVRPHRRQRRRRRGDQRRAVTPRPRMIRESCAYAGWPRTAEGATTRGAPPVDIQSLLGDEAERLLSHESKGIPKDDLTSRGPTSSTASSSQTDRSPQVLRNLQSLFDHGRLGGHRATCRSSRSTRASSTRRPRRSPPTPSTSTRRNIVELAIEGGCNAVATHLRRPRRGRPARTPTASRSS